MLGLFALWAASQPSLAQEPGCFSALLNGSAGTAELAPPRVRVAALRPTQFVVGKEEINRRSERIEKLSRRQLDKFLSRRKVSVVLGPNGGHWLVDGHHLALALVRAGIDEVNLNVVQDWSGASEDEFYARMSAAGYFYLFDKRGNGPLDPRDLPRTLDGLRNDPYRSLAWEARKAGCFAKSGVPFAEFRWAELFRAKIARKLLKKRPKRALKLALQLCRDLSARGLPGYQGQ